MKMSYSNTRSLLRYFLGSSVAVLALLLVFASAAGAETQVLTASGELAKLTSDDSNLVLDIAGTEHDLPGIAGKGSEARYLVRSRTGVLIAVWTRPLLSGEDLLQVATWKDGEWGPVHNLRADDDVIRFTSWSWVGLATDRARFVVEPAGDDAPAQLLDLERLMFHVVWQENDGRIRYSPLIFDDGRYIGWNETVTLSSAFASAHQADGGSLPSDMERLVKVGTDESGRLLVSLTDAIQGRIGTMKVTPISLLMEILGDSVFETILNAAERYDPEHPAVLADEMRAQIVYIGSRLELNPGIADYLADHVSRWIENSTSDFGWDLAALADASRRQTLDLGRSVYGITVPDASGDRGITLLDIGDFLDGNGHREEFSRLLKLHIAADFAAPETVGEAPTIHASPDGSAMALSWRDGRKLAWVENRGGGWSPVKTLRLSETLDAAEARELIEASIR